jgi:hypothetical protein
MPVMAQIARSCGSVGLGAAINRGCIISIGGGGQRHHRRSRGTNMTTATKCKRCGRMIVRNSRGVWVVPHSRFPSTLCVDRINPHEPDKEPKGDSSGAVTAIAVGASVFDAGLI